MNTNSTTQPRDAEIPWQLQMYNKSLKKRQKVELLMRLMGPISRERCLLISGHDNNGAMNYCFRAAGGTWSWGQVYEDGIAEMSEFLGEPVAHVDINRFPFADASFDVLIMIDVHEHFADLSHLNQEIARVVAPGGLAIVTTPNGDTHLPRLPSVRAALDDGVGGTEAGRLGRVLPFLYRVCGAAHQPGLRQDFLQEERSSGRGAGHDRSDLQEGVECGAQRVPDVFIDLSVHVPVLAVR